MSKRFTLFSLVSCFVYAVDYGVFNALYYMQAMHVVVANVFAGASGVVVSFLLNTFITFRDSEQKGFKTIIPYIAITSVAWCLGMALLWCLYQVDMSAYIAKLISMVVVFLFNYTMYRRVLFKV